MILVHMDMGLEILWFFCTCGWSLKLWCDHWLLIISKSEREFTKLNILQAYYQIGKIDKIWASGQSCFLNIMDINSLSRSLPRNFLLLLYCTLTMSNTMSSLKGLPGCNYLLTCMSIYSGLGVSIYSPEIKGI